MRLLGISGKLGTGKTSLAHLLLVSVPGAQRVAYGDLVKDEAARTFCFPNHWGYCESGKAEVVAHNGKLGIPSDKRTVRQILQWYGTEYRRAQDPYYWVRAAAQRIETIRDGGTCPLVIVDDVRMPNEAEHILSEPGGLLLRLQPFPLWKERPHGKHYSETALDSFKGWDATYTPAVNGLPLVCDRIIGEFFQHLAGGAPCK